MTSHPHTHEVEGHVFDSDGNPIDADIVLKRIDVDGEPCLSVAGRNWFAEAEGFELNRANDVQFCVPVTALAEPGIWTVVGVNAGNTQIYADDPGPQPQCWAEVVEAKTAADAVAAIHTRFAQVAETVVIAACIAGDVEVSP